MHQMLSIITRAKPNVALTQYIVCAVLGWSAECTLTNNIRVCYWLQGDWKDTEEVAWVPQLQSWMQNVSVKQFLKSPGSRFTDKDGKWELLKVVGFLMLWVWRIQACFGLVQILKLYSILQAEKGLIWQSVSILVGIAWKFLKIQLLYPDHSIDFGLFVQIQWEPFS